MNLVFQVFLPLRGDDDDCNDDDDYDEENKVLINMLVYINWMSE